MNQRWPFESSLTETKRWCESGEKSPGVVLKFLKAYPSKRLTPYHVQTHTNPRESV